MNAFQNNLQMLSAFAISLLFYLLAKQNELPITFYTSIVIFSIFIIVYFMHADASPSAKKNQRILQFLACLIVANAAVLAAESRVSRKVVFRLIEPDSPVHLGDAALAIFDPVIPLPSHCFTAEAFALPFSVGQATLLVEAKDIDPVPARGPFDIIINRAAVIHANEHPAVRQIDPSQEHSTPPLILTWALPLEKLRQTSNELSLCVRPTPFRDYDDVNVIRMEVHVQRRPPWRS